MVRAAGQRRHLSEDLPPRLRSEKVRNDRDARGIELGSTISSEGDGAGIGQIVDGVAIEVHDRGERGGHAGIVEGDRLTQ